MSAVYFKQTKDKKDKKKVVRYFNWKLAVVLIISLFVLGVGAFSLRQWHKSNRSQQGLVRGSKAYEQGQWDSVSAIGRQLKLANESILANYLTAIKWANDYSQSSD